MKINPYSERGLIIQFEDIITLSTHQKVKQYYKAIVHSEVKGVLSIIPAYNSITIIFDLSIINFNVLKDKIENLLLDTSETIDQKVIEIPVCYAPSLGLDIEEVATLKGMTQEDIIELHSQTLYTVYMLGFSPGFMYLGGLAPQLFTPRKQTPRLQIKAGAVGLADQQTGIYPSATPGGWQIIGQTPLSIFKVNEKPLVQMGDQIKFTPIDLETYNQMIV
ncbi:5-oxoprolinase subunit PxpB [Flammeovirga kamogawensis]|uniref:5-oxoprolinase subunit PxpB n=1 Tax=Flammeovirga kamogawensis TaxID=373891 RepID=A0ABX8GS86_9BACT|nr:5-oxoprolinase subunit PxpB [Flammeovirga kamogawensis]MBB6462915.1 inhibitor of KinA [Flammeovirga kamogawensis]QWG06444.1 5-oxoprolinase subunit PxpB [Flammeovirga kamogawensis]TRX68275.1 5-oxoprolinase subunit PxpB [Flammeovirga kamogawensis]